MNTKIIYILLTDTGTLFTKTIKKYTDAPYNHASLSLDENLEEMYSFGRRKPRNPLNGGFIKEDPIEGTYSKFPNTQCALYKLEIDEKNYLKIKRILEHFKNKQPYYTYNLVGLFGVIINQPIEFESSYFCSQFVAEVLKRGGVQLFKKPSSLVTPDDFRQTNQLTKIYEGKLYDYQPLNLKKNFQTQPPKELSFSITESIFSFLKFDSYTKNINSLKINYIKNPTLKVNDQFYKVLDKTKINKFMGKK